MDKMSLQSFRLIPSKKCWLLHVVEVPASSLVVLCDNEEESSFRIDGLFSCFVLLSGNDGEGFSIGALHFPLLFVGVSVLFLLVEEIATPRSSLLRVLEVSDSLLYRAIFELLLEEGRTFPLL